MRRLLAIASVFIGCAAAVQAAPVAIPAITYHDIVERRDADEFALTRDEFRQQLRYFKSEGYTPVSLRQLDAARRGTAVLPPKPVLLTFDDGLESFATHALPLLREHRYPAVLSIVTAWVDGRSAPTGDHGRVLSWKQLREIRDAGNVEIVSHSDDLHHGARSNPQGNLAAAGIARVYRDGQGYETEDAFRARIRKDLTQSVQRMRDELDVAPMAIAWPFGQYDMVTVEEAARLGMNYHFTLDEEPTTLATLPRITRSTFHRYRRLADLDAMLTFRKHRTEQLRFVEIALDDFPARSEAEREQLLSTLLARLELLRVNAVIIRPLSMPSGPTYFATSAMPVAADVLSRVIQQIRSRIRVDHIYLRLPERMPLAAWRDLARLNRYAGALIGETDAARIDELVALLRYYNPAVKLGAPSAQAKADFVFVELDAASDEATIESRVRAAQTASGRTLFLLRRSARVADRQLVDAMRTLRRAGARHFGYDNDDAASNMPALARVAPELRAHTVGTGGAP
jgi:poly-beta-1,6-N-acetyl-D-glucosamine N-deacetylase